MANACSTGGECVLARAWTIAIAIDDGRTTARADAWNARTRTMVRSMVRARAVARGGGRAGRRRGGGNSRTGNSRTGNSRTRTRAIEGRRLDEGYNCVIRDDGVIVAEDIPSGTYEVSAWWAGARNDGKGNAPRCDSERQRGCEVRCELTEDGDLVCEGLESGTYNVMNVKDLDEACVVAMDGTTIECAGAGSPVEKDTGDLNLKDSAQHGTRLGG